jgi:hypothetical protein
MLTVGDDDHGMRPDGTVLYRLDQRGHSLLASDQCRVTRVFVVVTNRLHERDGREVAGGQLTEEVRLVLEVTPCRHAWRVAGEVREGLVVKPEQLGRPAKYGVVPATGVPGP